MVLFETPDMEDDSNVVYVIDSFICSYLTDRDIFDKKIKIGTEMEDVLAEDENAVVFGDESYHRFSDISYVGIAYTYDENSQKYIVSGIAELDKEESVLYYLLPDDLAVIVKK